MKDLNKNAFVIEGKNMVTDKDFTLVLYAKSQKVILIEYSPENNKSVGFSGKIDQKAGKVFWHIEAPPEDYKREMPIQVPRTWVALPIKG